MRTFGKIYNDLQDPCLNLFFNLAIKKKNNWKITRPFTQKCKKTIPKSIST